MRWLVAAAGAAGVLAPAVLAQSAATEQRRTLQVDGLSRGYLVYLPSTYQAGRPVPLVFVFHGGGGRASGIAPHTGFSRLAEREGFVAVYPDGLEGRWNDGRGYAATHDDVGFVHALLDTLQRELSIDPRRVYATGISNGAMFAYRLACDLPGVFAAVAPVAGAMPVDLAPSCRHTEPVSVIAMQGTADPLMPYAGGGVARRRGRVLSADQSVVFWATLDGCTDPVLVMPEENPAPEDGTRIRRTIFNGCRDRRGVELYTVVGGGHTWPGGPPAGRAVGRVSRDIDATPLIWSFFAQHPKPQQ
jgi:polyhydroxybutyrate depolymerase